jgi:hypothetical protein
MPILNLHLTAFEITHSLTSPEIHTILNRLGPSSIETLTDYTFSRRCRLIKPMLSYDSAAIALSFLPAAGEGLPNSPSHTSTSTVVQTHSDLEVGRTKVDDEFTYHHLRRSLYTLSSSTGVTIESRYVVPSSHITVGRFLTQEDHDMQEKMVRWIEGVEEINRWLEREYWPKDGGDWEDENGTRGIREGGEWIVGQEKGLDCREGTLWYGGGRTVRLGKGF